MMVIDVFLGLKKLMNDDTKRKDIIEFNYMPIMIALQENKDAKLYFYKKGGYDLVKMLLQKELFTVELKSEIDCNLFSFLQQVSVNDEIIQIEMKDSGILRVSVKLLAKYVEKIFPDLDQPAEETKDNNSEGGSTKDNSRLDESSMDEITMSYKIMEELFELCISASMHPKVRLYIRDKHLILVPIFSKISYNIPKQIDEQYELYSSTLNLFANLFIKELGEKDNELKRSIVKEHSIGLLRTFG